MSGVATERLLSRLNGVKGDTNQAVALCPAHDDCSPSLSIKQGNKGAIIHCHAGCSTGAIAEAVGLTIAMLFDDWTGTAPPAVHRPARRFDPTPKAPVKPKQAPVLVATYDYTDAHGTLEYQVRRYEPKTFRQRRPDPTNPGQWISNLQGVTRYPYRYPDLVAAIERGELVHVVEGEKDADRLHSLGETATCNSGGAKAADTVDWANVLEDAHVVIVADKDEPGRHWAVTIRESIQSTAASCVVVEARYGKDTSDHLDHPDGTTANFDDRLDYELNDADNEPDDNEPRPHESFLPVDLTDWLNGEIVEIIPDTLTTTDGSSLLYQDRLNGIHGQAGTGKSWIMAYDIQQRINRGDGATMVIDLEDNPAPLIQRLRQIGVNDDNIHRYVVFVQPDDSFLIQRNVTELVNTINAREIVHVFIDSMGEALGLDGLDENNDPEVTRFLTAVAHRIVKTTAAGVTIIDHTTKAGPNDIDPSGSKRKRAAINGSSWVISAPKPLSKIDGGTIEFTCAKDRHGNYSRNDKIARLVMQPGGNVIRLEPFTTNGRPADDNKLRGYILHLIRINADGLNTSAIKGLTNRSAAKVAPELEALRALGKIRREDGPRSEQIWHYLTASPALVDPIETPRPGLTGTNEKSRSPGPTGTKNGVPVKTASDQGLFP